MITPTKAQMSLLNKLIFEIEPDMKLPIYLSKEMVSNRIQWLLKKKANKSITKKQFIN